MAVAGVLFVNDTDLMHLDMSFQMTHKVVHYEMRSSIHNWGHLLEATGWALKPEKCVYTLIAYEGCCNGGWKYSSFSEDDDYCMSIPVPGGGLQEIQHLSVTAAQKHLASSPSQMGVAMYS